MSSQNKTKPKPNYNNSFDNSNDNDTKKKQNKKIITLGKCSRLYLYILYSGLFKLLSLILLGDNIILEDGIGLFGFCPILYKYNFIQSIYIYIGYIVFGVIVFYFKGDDKKKDKKEYKDLQGKKKQNSKQLYS